MILARGLGSRMRRAEAGVTLDATQEVMAGTGLKAMIPVGRPLLDYILSGLAAGFGGFQPKPWSSLPVVSQFARAAK